MDRNVQHGEYAFFLIAVIRAMPHNVHHAGCDILPRSIKSSQIRNELARLDNEQTDFYRNNDRAKHTQTEIAGRKKWRQLIRVLFDELDELRRAA
jgi:hypothetical protein